MAIYVTALMSGQMVGPALGGVIGSVAGWRVAIAVSAAIGVAVVVICAAALAQSRSRRPATTPLGARHGDELEAAALACPALRAVRLALAPFATFFGIAGLTQTLIPLIGDGQLDFSASAIGIAIGVGAVARFASAWIAGVMSDRLSRRVVLVPCLALMPSARRS